MKRKFSMEAMVRAAIAGIIPTFGKGRGLGTERESIVPGRVTAPTWYAPQGNAGAYGRSIVGSKKYRAWKRKANRRARNANGGK